LRGRGTGEEGFYWARGLMSVGKDEGVPFLLSVDEQENRRAMRLLQDGNELEKRWVLLGWLIIVITRKSLWDKHI
jgi:hypothetical protein